MAITEPAARIEPYGFEPKFEEQVVYLLCSDDEFYRRIGFLVEPEALANPIAQELVKIIHRMVEEGITAKREKSKNPKPLTAFDRRGAAVKTTPLYVVQRLNQLSREEGRISNATVNAAMDYVERLTDSLDLEIDEEAVITLLAPELKRRMQSKAVSTAIGAYRDRKEFKEVVALLEEAEVLGEVVHQIGAGELNLQDGSTDAAIEALQYRKRVPTGIAELDANLGGGIPESCLLCILGSPGAGKSVCLNHFAVESVLAGQFTLYATLEVESEIVMSRFLANLTGVPINSLVGDGLKLARQIIIDIAPEIGIFEVKEFAADVTRVQHIKDWVHEKEQEYGQKCKNVIIDYADYLGTGDLSQHSYQAMKFIYRSMYSWAHKERTRILTASATKAKKDKNSTTGLDEASDSRYKARIVDTMLALDRTPEGLIISIPKNRAGKSLGSVGPVQDDFASGRLVRIERGVLFPYIKRAKERLTRLWESTEEGEQGRETPVGETKVLSINRPAKPKESKEPPKPTRGWDEEP